MGSLRSWERERVLLGIVAGGFVMLGFEAWFEHRGELAEHPITWAGPVTGFVVAALLVWAAAAWSSAARKAAAVGLAVSCLTGVLGFALHTAERLEHGYFGAAPYPPLAPLSFLGMGLVGLVLLAARWQCAALIQPALDERPTA